MTLARSAFLLGPPSPLSLARLHAQSRSTSSPSTGCTAGAQRAPRCAARRARDGLVALEWIVDVADEGGFSPRRHGIRVRRHARRASGPRSPTAPSPRGGRRAPRRARDAADRAPSTRRAARARAAARRGAGRVARRVAVAGGTRTTRRPSPTPSRTRSALGARRGELARAAREQAARALRARAAAARAAAVPLRRARARPGVWAQLDERACA